MNTWRPDAYHGAHKHSDFFEGWYFKFVNAGEQRRFAVIPGIFRGPKDVDSHCFVQTLDGVTGKTTYHRYPLEQFSAEPDRFAIRVGPSFFSADEISLNLDNSAQQMVGVLRFTGRKPWPVTWRSPGIMDWYAFVPFMETYHGVVSLDHDVTGSLVIDGSNVDFTGGRGYTEKDWGQAFPSAWVWMQTNHFDRPGVSLTASVARIPWLFSAFRGFIVGFLLDGQLYRFATYTGATIERLEVTHSQVFWTMAGDQHINGRTERMRLEIVADRNDERVDLLLAPYRTAMLRRVLESLTAQVQVRLTGLGSGQQREIFCGVGRHAGLEVGGKIEEIL